MAVMAVNIDKTLVAGMASGATASYFHNLPAPPDTIQVRFTVPSGATLSFVGIRAYTALYTTTAGATNVVQMQNTGADLSPNMEVTAIRFHSLIQ